MEAVHEGREFPMLMSLHLSILSRLILASHSLFAALCLTSANRIGSNHNDVAGKVMINPIQNIILLRIEVPGINNEVFFPGS